MGYENREYFRDGSNTGGGGTFMADAPMCKRILIVTVIVFLAQMFLTRPATMEDYQHRIEQIEQQYAEHEEFIGGEVAYDENGVPYSTEAPAFDPEMFLRAAPQVSVVQNWLELDTEKVKRGQVWRLITSAFCHDRFGIWHIVFNMLFLYWFGQFVESTYGSTEFLCFYLGAALVASLAYIGLEFATGDRHPAIGASGAVMGVVCVFALWNPNHTIRLYFMFPVSITVLLVIYVIYDLHPVLLALSGSAIYTGVAHAAHLGGLLFGFLYYKNDWRLAPWVEQSVSKIKGRRQRARAKKAGFRLFSGNEQDLNEPGKTRADLRFDEQLDDVLKKISDQGQESLTEREKKILIRGSQRYRKD